MLSLPKKSHLDVTRKSPVKSLAGKFVPVIPALPRLRLGINTNSWKSAETTLQDAAKQTHTPKSPSRHLDYGRSGGKHLQTRGQKQPQEDRTFKGNLS